MNPYLQLNQEMENANIFDILAKNTDKDKQNKARERFVVPSVADPGCLSRSLIFIPDPKTATKGRGEINYLSYLFL